MSLVSTSSYEHPLGLLSGELDGGSLSGTAPTLEAVRFSLYAGPDLICDQGRTNLVGSRLHHRLLRCSTDSLRTDCLLDTDLDGHPDAGDCNPTLSDVHPLWISPDEDPCPASGATYDYNCDGWTCP